MVQLCSNVYMSWQKCWNIINFSENMVVDAKLLIFISSNHNDKWKHPNNPAEKFTYPWCFGLIMWTQVEKNMFKQLLWLTVHTCKPVRMQFVFVDKRLMSLWALDRPLNTSSSSALTWLDAEPWGKLKKQTNKKLLKLQLPSQRGGSWSFVRFCIQKRAKL